MKKSIIALGMAAVLLLGQPLGIAQGNPVSEKSVQSSIYEDGVSENTLSDNNVSGNTVSANDVSGNKILGNDTQDGKESTSANTILGTGLFLATTSVQTERDYATTEVVDNGEDENTDPATGEKEESEVIVLDKPVITGVSMKSYKSVDVTWNAVTNAAGYEVYRSNKKYSGFKKIADKKTKLTITDKKSLKTGKTYYYKVRVYAYQKGQKIYSEYSAPKKIICSLPATKLSRVKVNANGSLKIQWKKVAGADGYAIYQSATKDGKYNRIKVFTSSVLKSCTLDASLCNGEYYYKVRPFRLNGKKKVYGEYSNAKKAKVNSFAYDGESYQDKCMRVFGVGWYKRYATMTEAQQNMTQITFNVWDFDSAGRKVTKSKTIWIHKNLAPTMQQIFKEIYEGKEQFPIKAVGGFSWRGNGSSSEHNNGTAIDINPNENCMVEGNGTVTSGSYWKPGEDPYSIPADGEVVKIFKKYGFRWGGIGWSSGRKDYMHFSYFGT